MRYAYNKMPKVPEIYKATRRAITLGMHKMGINLEDFAHMIGTKKGVLENKLKPACFTNDLNVTELIHIMDITEDVGPLEEIAKRYGYILCKPDGEKSEDGDAVTVVTIGTLDLGAVFGELEKVVKEAIEDGEIDEGESEAISKLTYEIRKLAKKLEDIAKMKKEELRWQ